MNLGKLRESVGKVGKGFKGIYYFNGETYLMAAQEKRKKRNELNKYQRCYRWIGERLNRRKVKRP